MTKVHFTTVGAKLRDPGPHPLFRVDRMYPAKFFHIIISNEPGSSEKSSVEENLKDITTTLEMTGVGYKIHSLILEEFWQNVATLAGMILDTEPEDEVVLNFSTGRRVFVSAMVLAGSLVKGWMPSKHVLCVQTSREYNKVVSFEPNLPMIPDNDDRVILQKIKEFEDELETNPNAKLTTDEIGDALNKGQSTISTRIKKLTDADYVEIQGHSKFLQTKGRALLDVMNKLHNKKIGIFDEETVRSEKRRKRQVWQKYTASPKKKRKT